MDRADVPDKFDYKVHEEQCPYVEMNFDDGYVCCTKVAGHEGEHVDHWGTALKDCVIPPEVATDQLEDLVEDAKSLLAKVAEGNADKFDTLEFIQRVAAIKC